MTGIYMASSGAVKPAPVVGTGLYTTPGTYTFIVPAGVTSISAVAIAAGISGSRYSGGNGGALSWTSGYAVSPGDILTVVVGAASGNASSLSFPNTPNTLMLKTGGYNQVGGGGAGLGAGVVGDFSKGGGGGDQVGTNQRSAGGGGAGGYTGAGTTATTTGGGWGGSGNPTLSATLGKAGLAGAGGGAGGDGSTIKYDLDAPGGGGGGAGLYGLGADGAVFSGTRGIGGGGGGGGGGAAGGNGYSFGGAQAFGGNGGFPGGGGGGVYGGVGGAVGVGADGAVRIIWGPGRSYPFNAL